MAITKSAKKQIRKNKRQRAHNVVYLDAMKSTIKELKTLITQKKQKEALALLPKVYAILDKTAKTGIIKKNNASRRKSRVTKMVDKITK